MKAKRITRAVAVVAAGALATFGLTGVANPADAATRSTVVFMETSAMTSLNSGTPDTNLVTNSDIGYMTGIGFTYYDDAATLVRNTKFGSFKVIKNVKGDFEVKYTVKDGQVWSDGTKIDAVDLLLSHVISNDGYSKKAGLGDPADSPKFNSVSYAGPYAGHVKNIPTLSSDHMSVTIKYDSFQPDWQILGPGPFPVHTLEMLAAGEDGLGSQADRNAAKAQFLSDFLDGAAGNTNANMVKIAKIWSNSYNIKTINDKTNPLLLVGNGAFLVDSAVADQSVTLVRNSKYNSGPAMATTNPINRVVFSFVNDGAEAIQALQNGDIDVYTGQPDASGVAQLKAQAGTKVYGGLTATWEHVDLRVGDAPGTPKNGIHYKGVFKGNSQKALDLRTAFLLAIPRDAIVNLELKPFAPTAGRSDSLFAFPGSAQYRAIIAGSGVSKFGAGTQAQRTAKALALVKKYYPNASAKNPLVPVNFLFKGSQRRIDENALIAAEAKKAGFNVSTTPTASWSTRLDDNRYDAAMYAWVAGSVSQTGSNSQYQSDGGNNHYGWNVPALDKILHSLEAYLPASEVTKKYTAAEKIIMSNAWTLPLYQWPTVVAANKDLKGVKVAPLTPNTNWNFWEWHY
jgi:peptide/nickel transport system substrate-binding protein